MNVRIDLFEADDVARWAALNRCLLARRHMSTHGNCLRDLAGLENLFSLPVTDERHVPQEQDERFSLGPLVLKTSRVSLFRALAQLQCLRLGTGSTGRQGAYLPATVVRVAAATLVNQ